MSNVILFEPKSGSNAKANLLDFIEFAKKIKPLGINQPFDENKWMASKAVNLREGYKKSFFHFAQIFEIDEIKSRKKLAESNFKIFDEPFLSFAKSVISYTYALAPSSNVKNYLCSLRNLHRVLLETTGNLHPSDITADILNLTSKLLSETYKTPYPYGLCLENIYSSMVELGLISVPTVWKSNLPRPTDKRRSGKEFDAIRNEKLPSPEALDGLAYIFNHPKDQADVVVTSVCALLLCDPDRIVEVITGPLDCIVKDEKKAIGQPSPGLRLRWYPAKNGDPMLKPVIASMEEVAERAIHNLKSVGAPARELALWYEENPKKIYLPPHLEYLRSHRLLSKADLNAILFDGKRPIKSIGGWININLPEYGTIANKPKSTNEAYISFKKLEKKILSLLPAGFPVLNPTTKLKYSEALCICRAAELKSSAPFLCVLQPLSYGLVAMRLSGKSRFQSIFEKHGLTDRKGNQLTIASHMFRHYLSMVGKAGGLSDIESNKWAGRSSFSHLRTYSNISDRDVLANIRNAVAQNKPELGPLANMDTRLFINRSEFANIRVITAHTTELGHCLRDFGALPCQLHGDHIQCNDHVVVKGEAEQEKNLRCEQAETCSLLEKAKTAMAEEEYGASMWVEDHTRKLARINQILRFIDDPNTPIGAVIQPSGLVPPSRIKQALEGRLSMSGSPIFSGMIRSVADVNSILDNQIAQVGGKHG